MSLYKTFKTDNNAETNGVWVEYPENEDGSVPRFKIARMSKQNKEYQKAMTVALRPVQRQLELKTLSNKAAEEIYFKVFIDKILLGWEKVQDEECKELPFSKENAKKLLTDLPELYDDLTRLASDMSLFKEASLEEDSKN